MKKFFALLCAFLLLAMTLQPVAFADDDDDDDDDELGKIVIKPLDKVDQIDLPTVLNRSLEDSHNLQLLSLKMKYLTQKKNDLDDQYDSLSEGEASTVHLPVTAQEFMQDPNYEIETPDVWMGPMAETNTVVNQIVYGQVEIVSAINRIVADTRDKLNIGSAQLTAELTNTSYQQNEAKEGIKLQETALYVQILSLKKQIQLLEDYQSVIQKDLDAAKTMNELGMSSSEDIRTLEKALNKQADDIKTARNNYHLALAQLAFDIGIEYNPDLQVKEIADLEQGAVTRRSMEDLLSSSYQMKIAERNLKEALLEEDETDTKNHYADDALDTNIEIAKEKILQLRLDLGKKIETTYNDAQNAYDAVQTEIRNNADVKLDYDKMKQRFDAGVVSKHDLDKFSFKVRQSDAMLELAKLKYYVLAKKAAAMDNGFIQ